jgi:acid phosphatase type 7
MHKVLKLIAFMSIFLFIITFSLPLSAQPKHWRATWWSNPSTTIAIGWTQTNKGEATIHYGERNLDTDDQAYPYEFKVNTPERGKTYWAQLSGLKPNTEYAFQVQTDDGMSRPLWFRTAAAQPHRMTIVAGGDSRNHRIIRKMANRTVAELQPDFVLFGGDYTSSDSKKQWRRWLEDWQLTIAEHGRLIPLIPAQGNHDSKSRLGRIWGRAHPKFYYGLSFGGQLLRVYTLNSERPAGGAQGKWLDHDLTLHKETLIKFAQYHKPMRPHVRMKSEGQDEYIHWAPLFAKHKVDLAIECDSHMMKMTYPLWPNRDGEDGFERVGRGTVFIGEGGWGAPLRSVSDQKSWTQMSARLNHFFYIEIEKTGVYRISPIEVTGLSIDSQGLSSSIGVKIPHILAQLTLATPLKVPQVQTKQKRKGIERGYSPLMLTPLNARFNAKAKE